MGLCVGGLEPNRWGLLRSTLTGKLEPSIYGPDGGLFFVVHSKSLLNFPQSSSPCRSFLEMVVRHALLRALV